MKVYAFLEENLEIDFCVQDQLAVHVVTMIDENVVIDFSNQIAKAGLASMDLASTHQKLESFITGAKDRYHKLNIEEELVEMHIIVSKLMQDARPESETYKKYVFYNTHHKVFVVVCIAWDLSFPKTSVHPPVDIDLDENEDDNSLEEDDDDDIPSIDEVIILHEKEGDPTKGCEKDASSWIDEEEGQDEIPSFDNGSGMEEDDDDDIPSIDEVIILHEKEGDPTKGCEKDASSWIDEEEGQDEIPSFDNGSGMEEDENDLISIDEENIPQEEEGDPTKGQIKKCVPTCPPDFPTDSEQRTAQELENKRLFIQFAHPEEIRAIFQVDEKKRPQIYRNMRQLLLNRMCPAVFVI